MSLSGFPNVPMTWSDVDAFCQQRIAEGAALDYKAQVPDDLEKTVAAMANTLGGTIVIGVREDQEAKPIIPLMGMEMRRGLAEQVMSKCIDNVIPPIVPEVQLCTNVAGDRALLVVRVPQSRYAPHAIRNNTRVYVRTGRQNDPDELANLDRILWMMHQRKESETFRELLFSRALARFDLVQTGSVPGIDESREEGARECLLTLAVSPVYPDQKPFLRAPDLMEIRRRISVRDVVRTADQFPIQAEGASNRIVEDGVIMHWSGDEHLRTYHTHLNIHGLYFFRQSLLWRPPRRHGVGEVHRASMRLTEVVGRAFCLLGSAKKFYQLLGYFGPLKVTLRLEKFLGHPLAVSSLAPGTNEYELRYSTDTTVESIAFTSTHLLEQESSATVSHLVQRVAWAFDWDTNLAQLEKYAQSLQL